MLKTNSLNCPLTKEISSADDSEITLNPVLKKKQEVHHAEAAVKSFSGNCVKPCTAISGSDDENAE
jgi:hypothetical protein